MCEILNYDGMVEKDETDLTIKAGGNTSTFFKGVENQSKIESRQTS
jgi:hypothetical protein